MTCIDAVKRLLSRWHILSAFSIDAVKDAETENLVVDRERAMTDIVEQNAEFFKHTEEVASRVEYFIATVKITVCHITKP